MTNDEIPNDESTVIPSSAEESSWPPLHVWNVDSSADL
jgi:hypothetical protein